MSFKRMTEQMQEVHTNTLCRVSAVTHWSHGCGIISWSLFSAPSCSTARQQCRSRRTWRRWFRYPSLDPEQWLPSTPNCLEHPCLSCESRVWRRKEYRSWWRGWWSISPNTVRQGKVKQQNSSSHDLWVRLQVMHQFSCCSNPNFLSGLFSKDLRLSGNSVDGWQK